MENIVSGCPVQSSDRKEAPCGCAWCQRPIAPDAPATQVAHGWLHDSPCLTEFNDWMATEEIEPEVLP